MIYFYYLLIPRNVEQDPSMFLKPEVLHNEDDVPIDNSHSEEVMVMRMARKIKAFKGVFELIQLIASDPNVKLTNNFQLRST